MDPTLAILDRGLKGDVGALSFLESTASIYIFDGTNPGQPKICGAWDFLSQALTEIERYEARILNLVFPPGSIVPNLEGHVQLLATMSRRAARRSPTADQNLVEICLTNASYRGSAEQARQLIDYNRHLREREMGRLAAMVFDFSYHRRQSSSLSQQQQGTVYHSAFSNPVAMDSLCAVVAANAISTGPHELCHLVSDWIIPSIDNLPPFAVASVTCNLAGEGMANTAPAGITEALKNQLFAPVVSKVLGPMLQEAVREIDHNEDATTSRIDNQRLASMVLKGLEKWSAATSCDIIHIKQVCQNVKLNIVEVISDTMYSDSEIIVDCLAELLETLLLQHEMDQTLHEGLGIVGSVMSGEAKSSLHSMGNSLNTVMIERRTMLHELVSAIGLQRFRFNERLAKGDVGVCRSLTSIARSVASAAQTEIKSGNMQGAENGFIDLLMKSVRHPSIHVCGIALEALNFLLSPRSDLSTQLLPLLQGKAIVPSFLVGLSSQDQCDVDHNEFERFREHLLTDILISCYKTNRNYYIESCTSAIDEFCSTGSTNAQVAYQLEAALFCLGAVSIEATKRAALFLKSPAAQEAAAKASRLQNHENVDVQSISHDSKLHDDHLAKTIRTLSNAPEVALSNPLFLSQMCRFIGKYAKWISQTPAKDIINVAASISLQSFDRAAVECQNRPTCFDEISVSPFADASTALRNILSRSPERFTSSDALSTLEKGWKSMYDQSIRDLIVISMEDKKALCTGISRVIVALPKEMWLNSLSSLTNPTIECIASLSNTAASISPDDSEHENNAQIIERLGEEISILAMTMRAFDMAASKVSNNEHDMSPVFSVLQSCWPCLTRIASSSSVHHVISASLNEILLVSISLSDSYQQIRLLMQVYEITIIIVETVAKSSQLLALEPIMELISDILNRFGPIGDAEATGQIREIIKQLLSRSFILVNSITTDAQLDVLPAMFSICTSGIQKCPISFMSLNSDQTDEHLFVRSISVAVSSISRKHADVARAAMLYLKEALISSASMKKDQSELCQGVISPFSKDIIMAIIKGTCGNFPREALDPSAHLLSLILRKMDPEEAENTVTLATNKEWMQLGDKGKHVMVSTLGKCAQGAVNVSLMMTLFEDIWNMHQSDDNGTKSLVGGDIMTKFVEKYS